MKQRLGTILFVILAFHVFASLILILNPLSLATTKTSKFYRTYLLPGPFYSDDKIGSTNTLCLAWKVNDQWSSRVNPANDYFKKYSAHFNIRDLYQSRFEQALLEQLVLDPHPAGFCLEKAGRFQPLKRYLGATYVPPSADSICLFIVRKRTQHFSVGLDSLNIVCAW
jgi:hypothetical protein